MDTLYLHLRLTFIVTFACHLEQLMTDGVRERERVRKTTETDNGGESKRETVQLQVR